MRSLKPWLVVFDLDGTLIDSSQDLTFSVNKALEAVGAESLEPDLITSFIGDGAAALVSRALAASLQTAESQAPHSEYFPKAFSAFLDAYRTHKLDTTKPYAGVREALLEIQQRAPTLMMAVLTNKPARPSREICEALQLAPFFFANYGGDSFPTKKPHPEGLLTIASEARQLAPPTHANPGMDGVVMIGDASPDVLVAKAVGARSVGCLYGLAPENLVLASPDLLVNSAREWPDALGL